MKKAIVTRSDSRVKNVSVLTHPVFKRFADKWNADFIVLNHTTYIPNDDHDIWRSLQFGDVLCDYDRIIALDTDVLINKTCPNLFEVVDEDKIGAVYEDVGSRQVNRRARIKTIQKEFGDVGWKSGYFNMGVVVLSKRHRGIFRLFNGKAFNQDRKINGYCGEQSHYGYMIKVDGHNIQELDYRYNHMSMFSESWNGSPSRFDSFMIHYAGGGRFPDKRNRSVPELIRDDVKKIYG